MRIERIEIKEEHLKLLKRCYVCWYDAEFGAPAIDPKKPYGNSSVEYDIAEILGWEYNNELTEEQYTEANKLHNELEKVLQICLSLATFETGIYELEGYGINWKKI